MKRHTRYQAAILADHRILLLKCHEPHSGNVFWLLPGGGREDGETEEACLQREVLEEPYLSVRVGRLLDEQALQDSPYQRLKTFECLIEAGEPRPGVEPEVDTEEHVTILAVGWWDLRDPDGWDPLIRDDPFTFPALQRLSRALGYSV